MFLNRVDSAKEKKKSFVDFRRILVRAGDGGRERGELGELRVRAS